MVHMLHECRWLKMVWTLGKPMHAKSKMRNQMWVIAKRQLLLIFSSYFYYSSITKSTSIVTKVFNGLVHRVRNNWRYLLKLGLYHMSYHGEQNQGYHVKEHKKLCQKQVSRVTLHFVWDQLSRKQTVWCMYVVPDIQCSHCHGRPNCYNEVGDVFLQEDPKLSPIEVILILPAWILGAVAGRGFVPGPHQSVWSLVAALDHANSAPCETAKTSCQYTNPSGQNCETSLVCNRRKGIRGLLICPQRKLLTAKMRFGHS